jgi:hypothetical protein
MRSQVPGNVVLAPDSVAAALAMTGSGGVGRTAREIAQALHLKGPAKAQMLACGESVVVDYERPLVPFQRKVRPISEDGRLSFGPRGVRLAWATGRVEGGSAHLGAWLRDLEPRRRPVQQQIYAVTRVRREGRRSDRGKSIGTRRQAVSPVLAGKRQRLLLGAIRVGARPAIYRVEVEFRQGRRLARYVDFVRVMRERVSVRVSMSADRYVAGQRLQWRLENPGTTWVAFGEDFAIEKWSIGGWQPTDLTPLGFPAIGYSIGSGLADECIGVILPTDIEEGQYRLIKPVTTDSIARELRAGFKIGGEG